ncbi:MAG TPA: hypothetical protein VF114_09575, partial [Candidatus Limnocylindria bacterium]
MSSTYPEGAAARVTQAGLWQRARGAPLARWQAVLTALAAVALVAYAVSVVVMLQERWLATNMGDAMRFDAIVNLVAA